MATTAPLAFEIGAASHPGRLRVENEDAYLDHAEAGLWAVADGMGGHDAGQLASQTLVDRLRAVAPPQSAADLLCACEARVVEANTRLRQMSADRNLTIGTTLAALLIYKAHYAAVWSGDSRIYRVRRSAITLLSRDHTEVQDLVETGIITEDERRTWPRRNVITRAIGVGPDPELEIMQGTLVEGDLFILCSDGLTFHLTDPDILDGALSRAPQAACDFLVALALDRGGNDNVTVMIVRRADAPGE